ncbi:MAG: LLM class flavin-dependent oxidoreductase [Pseudomonadota bacterium]|nr:LLM class flavin-dependent oxidoreductase [Pseudomonadota bacterium]
MTKKSIEFGIAIPQVFLNGRADMNLICRSLEYAENLGYQGAWVQDQVAGEASLLESVSLLCYASAVTKKMKLGVSVIVFPVRNAVQLAKSISSLDHMSNGRVILGIGLGPVFAGDNYFNIFGTSADEALKRFNEGLEVMKKMWTQPLTNLKGEFYNLKNAAMEPKPIQKPHPPIWFGGQHPKALERTVKKADGFMAAGPTPTKLFAKNVVLLNRFMNEYNRDPESLPISKRVYLAVDNDEKKAKSILDKFFEARYPWMIDKNPNFVADICVWGSPEKVTEGLIEVADAGAEMIVLNPIQDFVEQMERLSEEVIPFVKKN